MTNVNVKDQVANEVTYLFARLEDFDQAGDNMTEDGQRDWYGYVSPAISRARSAVALLTAPVPEAPGAPGAEEVNDIWRRHEAADKAIRYQGMLDAAHLSRTAHDAHTDRATLLSALDAERAARVTLEQALKPFVAWAETGAHISTQHMLDARAALKAGGGT